MEKRINKALLVLALMLGANFSVAEIVMVFDTVTHYKSGNSTLNSTIAGIEKDTGDSIVARFGGNGEGRTVASVCGASVITAMEKPGRYYLHVAWDETYSHVRYCMLELKAIPQ